MPWPVLNRSPVEARLANLEEEDAAAAALKARLAPVEARLGPEIAELLLDLATFHEREDKPAWWAIFDRLAQDSELLVDDLDSLQGLEAIGEAEPVTAKSYERTYRYPPQETKLRAGKKPCVKPAEMPEDIEIRALDPGARTVTLRRTLARGALPERLDLIPPKPVPNTVLRNAVRAVIDDLVAGSARSRAVEGLLTRSPPRFGSGPRPGGVVDPARDLPAETSAAVVGATAWHFARYDAPAFDHLVVDEAGQVSLANILAMSWAARNLVLVGDPMQLPQANNRETPPDAVRAETGPRTAADCLL